MIQCSLVRYIIYISIFKYLYFLSSVASRCDASHFVSIVEKGCVYRAPKNCRHFIPQVLNNEIGSNMQNLGSVLSTLSMIIQLCESSTKTENGFNTEENAQQEVADKSFQTGIEELDQRIQESFDAIQPLLFELCISESDRKLLQKKIHENCSKFSQNFVDKEGETSKSSTKYQAVYSICNTDRNAEARTILPVKSNIKRVQRLPKSTTYFLEQVYSKKQILNSRERMAIAKKCKISCSQVRIWFSNKRMRTKST
ncbi:hypothetical protein HG535_0D00210 [Zygotorulaspora mrakii]|uniref:Homeobox domain-containing protein n=1 Tax=Zygotorulaspora mrakii TaxID=42260 RepID=A0A7H9B1Q3_ZYGMR|nr:uncharacterized protein HG535_0D00210 [Zygotorulaspora mrakii]QLG72314.1 hypothetical protein HG535_0D00210 [Zygotorulaspora mrakii]